MRQLLEAGVHFGHQTRRWNPKMKPFIFAERNGIHIIDLAQTVQRLDVALEFVRETVARGDQVLFVGTKKQAQDGIESDAKRVGMPYVNQRKEIPWQSSPCVSSWRPESISATRRAAGIRR